MPKKQSIHPKDPLAELMIQKIAKEADIKSSKLLRFICPIYRVDSAGNPEQFGTGIYLSVDAERFLLTAAHVLDNNAESTLYIPSTKIGKLVELEGPSFRSISDDELRANDHTDVGVIRLEPELVEHVGGARVFAYVDG